MPFTCIRRPNDRRHGGAIHGRLEESSAGSPEGLGVCMRGPLGPGSSLARRTGGRRPRWLFREGTRPFSRMQSEVPLRRGHRVL